MSFTKQCIEELGYGYGLDGGGYCFEVPEDGPLADGSTLTYDGDFDYFPEVMEGLNRRIDTVFVAWRPYDLTEGYVWPNPIPSEWDDGSVYRVESTGWLNTTDRDCGWCEGTGEYVPAQEDEGTEHVEECPRCEGSGYVESVGGIFAVYVLGDPDELEQLAQVGREER